MSAADQDSDRMDSPLIDREQKLMTKLGFSFFMFGLVNNGEYFGAIITQKRTEW